MGKQEGALNVPAVGEDLKVFTCKSPAFSTRYPDITRKDLVPDNVLRAMEKSWNRTRFDESDINAYELKKVYVVDDGIVLNQEFLPIPIATTWQMGTDKIDAARKKCHMAVASGDLTRRNSRTVLCRKPGFENYGHWSIEMFPLVLLARRHLGICDINVNRPGAMLSRVMNRMLDLIEQPSDKVIWSDGSPAYFERLIVIDGMTRHGTFMSPIAPALLRTLEGRIAERKTDRKLFITRGASPKRKLINEDSLWQKYRDKGFTKVDPGLLSLDEQISFFRDANEVVGVIGAALTNLVFCKAGTEVTIWVPDAMPDTFFWFLCQHLNLQYREIRGRTVGKSSDRVWNGDFIIE